jgi:trigger factor
MALQVTTEPRENRQLGMSIVADPERVQKELRKAAQKFAGQYRIPGFRKGKAPFHVVAQQIGLHNLFNEFADQLGQELYKAAIEQEGIQPYATATIEGVDLEPLTYKLLVPLDPEVDLGDYRSLRVAEEAVEVTDAQVDEQVEIYRAQHAGWVEVTRPSQYGDTLTIHIRGVTLPAPGAESSDGSVVLDENDWDVTPDQEHPMGIPGLDEALLGLTTGEEKEFLLSWPEESQSIHAGKTARFQVKVNRVRSYEKPALDDQLAQLVGPDFATLDDLKANIRATLQESAKTTADVKYTDHVLNTLVEQSKLVYPPVVVIDQINTMVEEFERQLHQLGIDSLENYLQRTSGITIEQYRQRLQPDAQKLAEQNLVISEVLRTEKLQVADDEIEERINLLMGESVARGESEESTLEMLHSPAGRTILESQILREKAVQRLLAIARGEPVPDLAVEGAEPPSSATEPEAETTAA